MDRQSGRWWSAWLNDAQPFLAGEAWAIASKIFAEIGVTILWRRLDRVCPADGIQISLFEPTLDSLGPGALAYALPYEGTHICVFYDRVAQFPRELIPRLLAHVLAHEITHILQGIARHSDHGVMKARWDSGDFADIRCKPLGFTHEDVELIYKGLAVRAARLSQPVMATNSEAAAVTARLGHNRP